jgi:hypothetical protein
MANAGHAGYLLKGGKAWTFNEPMQHGGKNDPSKPKYTEPHIPARSCCGLCLYNIPSGTMMSLLPGIVLLIVGSVSVLIGHVDENWTGDPEFIKAGFIMLALGALLTIGSTIYCAISWSANKPKKSPSKQSVSPHTPRGQVSLVAVHKLPDSPKHNGVILSSVHTGNGTLDNPGGINPAIT